MTCHRVDIFGPMLRHKMDFLLKIACTYLFDFFPLRGIIIFLMVHEMYIQHWVNLDVLCAHSIICYKFIVKEEILAIFIIIFYL